MMGFSYQQLYDAMQEWPLKKSAIYLQNINRMIFLGELRTIIDLELDIFDVTDLINLTIGQSILPKPPGSQPLTFNAAFTGAEVTGTLVTPWAGTTGNYVVTFSNNQLESVALTASSAIANWGAPLVGTAGAIATIAPQFIVEKSLWCIYGGKQRLMTKRSWEFLQNYIGATPGRPLYFADQGQTSWIMSPAADALATQIKRTYLQRPPSIVVAGNTWIGDNVGELLFAAALMESEQFLKADDRYGDWKTKYYSELLPGAKAEVMYAGKSGIYTPMAPVATIEGPPQQQAPQQG